MDIKELNTELNFIKWEIGNISHHCEIIRERIDKFQKELYKKYEQETKKMNRWR